MVELSRSFTRDRLQRQPAAATLSGVPGLPRIPDDSGAMAQASATFAQGLKSLGQALGQIAERDAQLKRADDVAKAGQAVGQFSLGMGEMQQGLVTSNVPALERPQALRTGGEELINTLVQNVPQRAQERFKAEATQALARMVLSEQSSAAQQFVSEQKAALPPLLDLLGRQLLTADDRQRPDILASMTATATSFAEAGIIPAPLGQALVREAVDRNDTIRTQQAIVAQPSVMRQHLRELAAGNAGTPGLPVPAAKDLPDLVRQADSQVAQDVARLDREERQAGQKLQQTQSGNMVRLQSKLYYPDLTIDEVNRINQEAVTLGQQRQITEEDQRLILQETRTISRALIEGPVQTAPEFQARVLTDLYGTEQGEAGLNALRADILQGVQDGKVNLKDATGWMQEISRQRNANYYTKNPSYQENRQFLDQAVNYLAEFKRNPTVNQEAVERVQSRVAHAMQEYSMRMREIWEREGPRGVEAQAPQVAREVQAMFGTTPREVLDYFPEPSVLSKVPRSGTLEERYTQAYHHLQAEQMADKDKAEMYRQLRSRQRLEEAVEQSEKAEKRLHPPAVVPTAPPPKPPPRPFNPQEELERQKRQGFGPGQTVPVTPRR